MSESETKRRSMGHVLRQIGGGEVEIICYETDFNVQQIPDPRGGGATIPYPCQTLFGFKAASYREVGHSDLWEFTTLQDVVLPDGSPSRVRCLVHLRGEDIFTVRVISALVG